MKIKGTLSAWPGNHKIGTGTNIRLASWCLCICVSLAACHNGKQEAKASIDSATESNKLVLTPQQEKNIAVKLGNMEETPMRASLKLTGKIDVPPQNMVSVCVPTGGYLKETKLLPGMKVTKGSTIAIIEDKQFVQLQEDFLGAKSKAVFCRAEYDRQRSLNESKASSDKALQQAKTDWEAQEIMIASLSEKLRLAGFDPAKVSLRTIDKSVALKSPIDGYVTRVNFNVGKYVAPTDVLFELIDPTDIHLALKVFEKDIPLLTVGQKIMAYTNYRPDKKYPCALLLIGKEIGPERNTEVHCHFEGYDPALLPGTYMNADLETDERKAWTLPETAVLRYSNKRYVFLAGPRPATYSMEEVEIGLETAERAEVRNPSAFVGKQIVLSGSYALLMALKNKSEE